MRPSKPCGSQAISVSICDKQKDKQAVVRALPCALMLEIILTRTPFDQKDWGEGVSDVFSLLTIQTGVGRVLLFYT